MNDAKAVCKSCPARSECLEFAIASPDIKGIWSGTTERERSRIRRQRRVAQQPAA